MTTEIEELDAEFYDDCWQCGGEGWFDGYEEDPLWYEPGDLYMCPECRGRGRIKPEQEPE